MGTDRAKAKNLSIQTAPEPPATYNDSQLGKLLSEYPAEEASLNDADIQPFAVQAIGFPFFCAKHFFFRLVSDQALPGVTSVGAM